MSSVRLYGVTVGYGSFARVTAGMRLGLTQQGAFAGLVPLDAYGEDDFYPGYDADIGVYVGPPSQIAIMSSLGAHRERWLLLPPNSTWVPRPLLARAWPHVTGFLSPSTWGYEVLGRVLGDFGRPLGEERDISVWQHGVLPEFQPDRALAPVMGERYYRGHFDVLHMASTDRQRKGTKELLQAWTGLVNADRLGRTPRLRVVLEAQTDAFEGIVHGKAEDTVTWTRTRLNLPPADCAALYRDHHLVCQPSRGEGFGLVPLEALACGVPISATDVTGHSEYMVGHVGGLVRIPTGLLAPIDDGPGADAPALDPLDVAASLRQAYQMWPILADEAQAAAEEIRSRYAWSAVTDRWLRRAG